MPLLYRGGLGTAWLARDNTKRLVFVLGKSIYLADAGGGLKCLSLPDAADDIEDVRFWGKNHDVLALVQLGGEVAGIAWWRDDILVECVSELWIKASVAVGGELLFAIRERGAGMCLVCIALADATELWSYQLPSEQFGGGATGLCAFEMGVVLLASTGSWCILDTAGRLLRSGRGNWRGDVEAAHCDWSGRCVALTVAGMDGCIFLDTVEGQCRLLER